MTVFYEQIVYGNIANQSHGLTIDNGKFILKLHRLYAVSYVISRVAIIQSVINTCSKVIDGQAGEWVKLSEYLLLCESLLSRPTFGVL